MAVGSSLSFNYDGQWSYDMGVANVNVQDSGLFQDVFAADREIREVTVRHRKKPYFQRIQDNPITLTLRIFFDDPFDSDSIRKVAKWLCGSEQYKELYFSDNIDRRFFAMYAGTGTKLQHNGNGEGYIDIAMRCDAPYSYSPQYTETYDFSTNGGGSIDFSNDGDASCYPEVQITKFGNDNGDITITNNSNGGQVFKLSGAKKGTSLLTVTTNVVDGMTVQIGRDLYEFDTDSTVNSTNIKVSVPSTDLSANTAVGNLVNIINTSASKVENIIATVSTPTIISGSTNTTGTTQYNYQIVALDASNNVLSTSNMFTVSSGTTLSTTDTVTINWLATTNVSNYAIYRTANSSTSLVCFQSFNPDSCTWTDNGATAITPPTGVPSVPSTPSVASTTITVTNNVMGNRLSVGTNFPSVILWDSNYIDGSGIIDQEIVYIDNENQIIVSSLPNTYRYDAFNDNYLELVEGMNYLVVSGYCTLEIRWREILIQG